MGDVDQDSMDVDNELPIVTKTNDTLRENALKEKQIVETLIGSL